MADVHNSPPTEPAALAPPEANAETTSTAPDQVEEELDAKLDDAIPTHGYHTLPIVGLGGSAGSLTPLQEFFEQMPADSGMGFVVILHLSPEHESTMAAILQRSTRMPVTEVSDNVKVEPNHVYVIPPGKLLSMSDGTLSLTELERERGKRVVVDLFFRTLADTHGPNAIAVVLSGADGDGSIGIKRVKERGGLTIAQDPQESEHSGMPRSAIETGMIDWILRAADMPPRIIEFRRNGARLNLPELVHAEPVAADDKSEREAALRNVLAVVRARTGRDFTGYKRGTILRRIARRMQVNAIESLVAYHGYVRTHPAETGALLQDLLISVTNFFRDRESFEALAAVIPELFVGKRPTDTIRVWVTACATGEEAYTVAILLHEHAARLDSPPQIQVFATDIDEAAIATARAALYPETIVADVSEERLRRFFVRQQNSYRVIQSVRECILFAVHDVLKDAPFSRIDLITCRNLLIYLARETQVRVFDIFHFALRPDGQLFLGTSETAEDASALFDPINKKYRIYRRLPTHRVGLPVPVGPVSLRLNLTPRRDKVVLPQIPVSSADAEPEVHAAATTKDVSWSDLHFKLIERFAPPSLVIDRDHHIIHLSPSAGRYLQFTGGEPTMSVLHLVHPMLRIELRAALFRASESNETVEVPGVPVEFDSGLRLIDLSVRPAPDLAPNYFLIVFNERDAAQASARTLERRQIESEGVVRSLERELELVKQQLRSSQEQHGASTEEMKASNEELQAMNEELRSASEELETSREELQSINEELLTVNQELKVKVDELGRSNGDLQNLMSATNVATVFLDGELRIKRYTPPAVTLFKFIPSDLGRPLFDLRLGSEFDVVFKDAQRVLGDVSPIEREVHSGGDRWFLTRVTAYRTSEGRIAGVVLTFIDITERKQAESAVRESEARFRALFEQTAAGICRTDLSGRLVFVNPRMTEMLGWSEAELVGKSLQEMGDDQNVEDAWFDRLSKHGTPFQIEKRFQRKDGTPVWVNVSVSAILDAAGQPRSTVAVLVDITERMAAEERLNQSERRFRALLDASAHVLFSMSPDWSEMRRLKGGELIFGEKPSSRTWLQDFIPVEDQPAMLAAIADARRTGSTFELEHRMVRQDGVTTWMFSRAVPIKDNAGIITEWFGAATDITVRRSAEEALRRSIEQVRLAVETVGMGFWEWDIQNGTVEWEPTHNRMIGLPIELKQGTYDGFFARVHPDDRAHVKEALKRAVDGDNDYRAEFRVLWADGSERWISGYGRTLRNSSGAAVRLMGAILDVTERKKTENLLRTSKERLEERVQARTSDLDNANRHLRAEIVERKRAEASREEIMRALVAAQEAERGRISRELHDEVGQHLTALLLGLKALQTDFHPAGAASTTLQSLLAITENVGREIHEVALELRPTALDDLGLVRALSTFLEDWAQRAKVEMDFDHSLGKARLPSHLETTLYRVICEALHNVVRHANATRVSVILQRKTKQVVAIVEDNGIGFDLSGLELSNRKRLGIIGMKERVALVDGELAIESAADRGTTVIVRLPIS